MRETVLVSFGQAGIQCAHANWELFCVEHGISPDGMAVGATGPCDQRDYIPLFLDTGTGKVAPRSIMIDTEPSVADEIRRGPFRALYNPDCLITGLEDTGGNFARGYKHCMGLANLSIEMLRRQVEACDSFQGFLYFRSLCGGTGSGLGSYIMQCMSDFFPKSTRLAIEIYSSPTTFETVDPYNCVLGTHYSMDAINVAFITENSAICDLCRRNLNIGWPKYDSVNRVIAQVTSGLTCSFRFESPLTMTLDQFQTNLVPYPRLHYTVMAAAPLLPFDRAYSTIAVPTMVNSLFSSSNQLLKCDTSSSKFISITLLFRGNISPTEINQNLQHMKGGVRGIHFIDWAPSGFKIGLCPNIMTPPCISSINQFSALPRSVVGAFNTTAVRETMQNMKRRFAMLTKKKAFMHHFILEGMDESELTEAKNNLIALDKDYQMLCGEDSRLRKYSKCQGDDMTLTGRGIVPR